MNKKTEVKGARGRAVCVITLVLAMTVIAGLAVWMVTAGHAETAMVTVMGWSEDGTIDAFEEVVVEDVIPMLGGIAAAVGGGMAVLCPTLKKLREAKKQMDTGTEQAVSTYGERKAMQEEMQTFMEEQRRAADEIRREQREALEELKREQRESLASDRAAIKRIEGKVDGIRRVEAAAFGATGELVKKGTATQIVHIIEETEGMDPVGEEEGGDVHEDAGDDGEAAQDEEAGE